MGVYAKSLLRLKARGLVTEAMVDRAVELGRITAQEAAVIKGA